MKIRALRPADIPQVIALWQEAGDYHDWMDTPEALTAKADRERGLFLVAEEGGKVVGTVMGGYDGRIGQVMRLAVTAGHRRRGTATALMAELEDRLRRKGAPQVSLLVWGGNAAAISLYRKLGYELREGVCYMKKRLT